jgi:hypothetical protein
MPRLIKRKDNYTTRRTLLSRCWIKGRNNCHELRNEWSLCRQNQRLHRKIYTISQFQAGVQMKCSQILFDLILRHKSFNMNSRSDQGEFKIKAEITRRKMTQYTFKRARFKTR